MNYKELVESVVPDFLDVEITSYIQHRKTGEEQEVVRIEAENNGQALVSETMWQDMGDDFPEEALIDVKLREIEDMLKKFIRASIEQEAEERFGE